MKGHWGFECLIVDKLWDERVERLFAMRRWSRKVSGHCLRSVNRR